MVKFNNSNIQSQNKIFFNSTQVSNVYFGANPNSYTKIYQYDNEKPTINMVTTSYVSTTQSYYVISGYISDSISGVKEATLNGSLLSLGANGYFQFGVYPYVGNNTYNIVVADNAGNITTTSVTIYRYIPQAHEVSYLSCITGDNGDYHATHSTWFLEQGESKQVDSDVSWAGWLIVSGLPAGTTSVTVNFLGNRGAGSATYTDLSSNIRLSDSDHESMWCNETGRNYEVKAEAGIRSIIAYY